MAVVKKENESGSQFTKYTANTELAIQLIARLLIWVFTKNKKKKTEAKITNGLRYMKGNHPSP